jgi:hypothetical protein
MNPDSHEFVNAEAESHHRDEELSRRDHRASLVTLDFADNISVLIFATLPVEGNTAVSVRASSNRRRTSFNSIATSS